MADAAALISGGIWGRYGSFSDFRALHIAQSHESQCETSSYKTVTACGN